MMNEKQVEALELAREALKYYQHRKIEWDYSDEATITAIDEALAHAPEVREQPAQQEPVAYIRKDQLQKAAQSPMLCEVTPEPRQDRIGIFTSPQSKPWRGLTDEQIAPIIQQYHWLPTAFARAIEAKLRELNEHKEKNA